VKLILALMEAIVCCFLYICLLVDFFDLDISGSHKFDDLRRLELLGSGGSFRYQPD
jgi:hypothetical protein